MKSKSPRIRGALLALTLGLVPAASAQVAPNSTESVPLTRESTLTLPFDAPAEAREAVLAQRRRRGMVLDAGDHDTWSCGSFFTNPILSASRFAALESRAATRLGPDGPTPPRFPDAGGTKTSAAWLIEQAGFTKGFALPGSSAAISSKHTLALTNRGGATAAQVADLARAVRDGVHDAFGVTLVNEPVLVGHAL